MANMLFANNCNTTLNGGITAVATSMVVTSATGFPVPTGSQYFYCTLADAATQTTIEIVKVTAVSGTTFTIVRGQDGTTGTIFASGAVVSLRLVRASLNDFPKLDEANTFTQAQTFSALTSGRVPYSTTGGLQTDNANLTFDGTNLSIGGAVTSTIASKTAAFGAAGGSIYTSYYDGTKTWRSGAGIEASGVFSFYNVTDATNPLNLFASGGVSIGNTTDPGATNLSVTGNISLNSVISTTFYTAINSSTPTTIATGISFIAVVRDRGYGGSALVLYENNNTPVIISQVGTAFTTISPLSTQIQLANLSGGGGMTALAGSARNPDNINISVIKNQ